MDSNKSYIHVVRTRRYMQSSFVWKNHRNLLSQIPLLLVCSVIKTCKVIIGNPELTLLTRKSFFFTGYSARISIVVKKIFWQCMAQGSSCLLFQRVIEVKLMRFSVRNFDIYMTLTNVVGMLFEFYNVLHNSHDQTDYIGQPIKKDFYWEQQLLSQKKNTDSPHEKI